MAHVGEPRDESRRVLMFPSGGAFPSAPSAVGEYQLVGEIARGGMGTVFLCRRAGEAGFQRLYALKLMHPHLAEDSGFIGMFLDEARIAARIHHPNVVGILDLGVSECGHYVVMEYVEGCALSQLLQRERTERPPHLLVPILIDLLTGLHAAHSLTDDEGNLLRLVHRDVSPSNVLVGADGVARLTDFGIAKARSRITSTKPGVHKGKLTYTAPEQLRDAQSVDARADVFSAGVTLWTALTGRSLFRGDSEAETINNLLNREVPRPSHVGLKPPACFDRICMRALERDPNLRYGSALEMVEDLRQAALEEGLYGAPADVARWVSETFSAELDARRRAIRQASAHSAPPSEAASLPALPAIHHTAEDSSHSPLGTSSLEPRSDEGEEYSDLEIREQEATTVERRLLGLRVPPAVGLAAVLVVALALGIWVSAGPTMNEPPESAPAPAAPNPEAASPAAAPERPGSGDPARAPSDEAGSPALAETEEAEAAPSPPEASDRAEPPGPRAEERKKKRPPRRRAQNRRRPQRPRRQTRRRSAATERAAAGATRTEPAADGSPASAGSETTEAESSKADAETPPSLERNPYLRRR